MLAALLYRMPPHVPDWIGAALVALLGALR